MASGHCTVVVALKNHRALEALALVNRFIEETCEDAWNPEAKRALKAMRYVVKNITLQTEK